MGASGAASGIAERSRSSAGFPIFKSRLPDNPSAELRQRGPQGGPLTVEDALAGALAEASAAGRWDVVAQLARELEARRLAPAGNVVALDVAGSRRPR